MKENKFEQFIENTRDCDTALLDVAIRRGITRARSRQFDKRKILSVAVLGAIAAVFCIALTQAPVQAAVFDMVPDGNLMDTKGAEALQSYIEDFAETINTFFGG